MTNKRKLRAAIAILSLIASMLAVQAAFPSAAQARCTGKGTWVTSQLYNTNGNTGLLEQPIGSTCDGNGFYAFRFRSDVTGFRASVYHQDNNGGWHAHHGGYDKNWHSDSFRDSNSWANMFFCLDDGFVWYCGVGTKGAVSVLSPTWDSSRVIVNRGF